MHPPTVLGIRSCLSPGLGTNADVAMDGNPLGPASPDRPFLLLGNQGHRRIDDPDWAGFYDRLRGPRVHLIRPEPARAAECAVAQRVTTLS